MLQTLKSKFLQISQMSTFAWPYRDMCYADLMNYLTNHGFSKGYSRSQKEKLESHSKYYIIFGIIPTYERSAQSRSFADVYQKLKFYLFCSYVILQLVVVTFGPNQTVRKVLESGLTGLKFLEIHTHSVKLVIDANRWEI